MKNQISHSTEKNWKRLHTDGSGRLTSRANKTGSKRHILPVEYLTGADSQPFLRQLAALAQKNRWETDRVLYTLARRLLKQQGLWEKNHVRTALRGWNRRVIPALEALPLPEDEWDLLGLAYQCLLSEGQKNQKGSYYTPRAVAASLTQELDLGEGQTFLDPCCGSGAFLLTAPAQDPAQLFGLDNDPLAVWLARVNLLLRWPDRSFRPQVFCQDYLAGEEAPRLPGAPEQGYDFIVTNPPWGGQPGREKLPGGAVLRESFACFYVRAYGQLKPGGGIRFLFPEALLRVRAHRDLRHFVLTQSRLYRLTFHEGIFTGVTTRYVDVYCRKEAPTGSFVLRTGSGDRELSSEIFFLREDNAFCPLQKEDMELLHLLNSRGKYDLRESGWALGIVTGDNRRKLFPEAGEDREPIYTGRDIGRYRLGSPSLYLHFDRGQLQQAAADEYYRAKEKLVYRFISDRPVFAYDDTGSLFLNSANILLPRIPGMSIKTVLAFLDSELFAYYYRKLCGQVKMLKGELSLLRFPELSPDQDQRLTRRVEAILRGEAGQEEALQREIYSLYGLTEEQQYYIRSSLNEKSPFPMGEETAEP